jgi:hypothetical protein
LSSILRALKKLENEPKHLEETQTLGSKFVPLADTGTQKTPTGIILMVVGGGIVCAVVLLAGWWFFSGKTPSSLVAPQEISGPSLQQTEMVPVTTKQTKTSENSSVSVEPAKSAADIPAHPETSARAQGATLIKIPQPLLSAIVQRTVMATDEQTAELVTPVPATSSPETAEQVPAEEIVDAATRPHEVSTKVEEIEIPALSDPEIKLQAITWSKNPLKRIVVINNRILRQGEMVLGYRIDSINQDDVVLNDAGNRWKLIFRIK